MNNEYLKFLKNKVFKVNEFDQFELLFDALDFFLKTCKGNVAIVERSYIYGGRSLFAPLVYPPATPVIINYLPLSGEDRANYQGSWLDDSPFNYITADETIRDRGSDYHFSFDCLDVDALVIPNVLHHCRDFPVLMESIQAASPKLKRVFIFDSYIREEHQAPDDYCRYTPSALEVVMRKLGFGKVKVSETGNVFDGLLYLISQARWQLENLPELSDLQMAIAALVPQLRSIRREERYRSLGRPHASLSTAYAMSFER